jgi:hypothetical protein
MPEGMLVVGLGVGAPVGGSSPDRRAGPVYEPPERLVGQLAARPTGALMTVARSVADVLDDHVVFEVESIDRMYLNVWQPRLAYGGGVQGFSSVTVVITMRPRR